jgi:hypothetical protein
MDERNLMLLELSIPQWIAFIGFAIATVGFFIWVVTLARKRK